MADKNQNQASVKNPNLTDPLARSSSQQSASSKSSGSKPPWMNSDNKNSLSQDSSKTKSNISSKKDSNKLDKPRIEKEKPEVKKPEQMSKPDLDQIQKKVKEAVKKADVKSSPPRQDSETQATKGKVKKSEPDFTKRSRGEGESPTTQKQTSKDEASSEAKQSTADLGPASPSSHQGGPASPSANQGGPSWMQRVAQKTQADMKKESAANQKPPSDKKTPESSTPPEKHSEPSKAKEAKGSPPWMNAQEKPSQKTTPEPKTPEEKLPQPEKTPSLPEQESKTDTPPQPQSGGGSSPPSSGSPVTSGSSGKPPKDSPFKKLIPIVLGVLAVGLLAFVATRILGIFKKDDSTKPSPGGGQEPTSQTEPVTLKWWGLWEPRSVVSQIILDYQKSHPNVTINYSQQNHTDYRERLQSALARGEGPDIFRFHNTWVPMLQKDLTVMPSNIYSASEFESTFYPIMNQDLKVGTGHVGVPLMYEGLALFYNKQMLTDAGIEVPTTWEQFRKAARDLTEWDEDGEILVSGAALGTTNNVDEFSDILGLMMLQNGANPAKPTGQLAEDAINFYTIFVRQDQVWSEAMPASQYAFATKKTAMMLAPSWRALEISATNPDLEFGVAPVPQLPGTKINWASYWSEGVSAKSPHQKEAWDFLKYLSQKDTLQKVYTAASQERGFGEIYPRVDMKELLTGEPIVGAYVNQAPDAQTWYMCSRTHDNGLNDRIIKYYQDAINAVLDGQSPTAALETAAQGVNQVLGQYKISQ